MTIKVPFDQLPTTDLQVGAIYEGGSQGNAGDDALARLLPCGNQGGFRFTGERSSHSYRIALLYTSGTDTDWPDSLDVETGIFTYFGDNKTPGSGLHETPRGGNELLRFAFECVHGTPARRDLVPPFFVFRKAAPRGRDVQFLGLAVPGARSVDPSTDLVAVWRSSHEQRFQNYRATFTVLDIATINRSWIEELGDGQSLGPSCPAPFQHWVEQGSYAALEAPRTTQIRSIADQTPAVAADKRLVEAIHKHYSPDPHGFEACAMELWKMLAKESVTEITATRRSADGGRDAFGLYSIGPPGDRIHLNFSLEAKCYAPKHGAGVRDIARLISRLRHRQFGVFVTTSYVGKQAYQELREDRHPVVVISGRDIAELLKERGVSTPKLVRAWLAQIDDVATP